MENNKEQMEHIGKNDGIVCLNPAILTIALKVSRLNIPCRGRDCQTSGGGESRPSCMLFTRNIQNVDIKAESKLVEKIYISGKKIT